MFLILPTSYFTRDSFSTEILLTRCLKFYWTPPDLSTVAGDIEFFLYVEQISFLDMRVVQVFCWFQYLFGNRVATILVLLFDKTEHLVPEYMLRHSHRIGSEYYHVRTRQWIAQFTDWLVCPSIIKCRCVRKRRNPNNRSTVPGLAPHRF